MVWIVEKSMWDVTPKTDEERRDMRAYNNPLFVEWLRKDFVHVVNKPRVMDAFWKWSAFGPSHGQLGNLMFAFGYPPKIELIELRCDYTDGPDGGGEFKRHGKLKGCDVAKTWSAESIGITEEVANMVWIAHDLARKGKAAEASLILEKVEATILHEMIHWSYYVNKLAEERMPGYGGDIEYGTRKFEQEAYGHVVGFDLSQFVYIQPTTEPYFGASVEMVNKAVTITKVDPNFAADRAGVKSGDVLVKFDGRTISSKADFTAQMEKKQSGEKVLVEVRRGGKVLTLSATLDDAAWQYLDRPGK